MLKKTPEDIEKALKIEVPKISGKIENIVICGMGGSGIVADILRDYMKYDSKIPVIVVKSSRLPAFVGSRSLVIAVTCSGKTWETLSCIKEAKKKKAKLIVVTAGETKEKNCLTVQRAPIPRMSLAHMFFPLLLFLEKNKLVRNQKPYVKETISLLKKFNENKAKEFADKINGVPFIFGPENFSSVVLRWRNQFNENSKVPAHSNFFTELNHNEIEAIFTNETIIILRDKDDEGVHIEVPEKIFKNFIEVRSEGKSLLARMFYSIYFGDWVSYFLAQRRSVDPVKNDNIDFLKRTIHEHRAKDR
jgi:glucose/mannose-6-phosphate isomerase